MRSPSSHAHKQHPACGRFCRLCVSAWPAVVGSNRCLASERTHLGPVCERVSPLERAPNCQVETAGLSRVSHDCGEFTRMDLPSQERLRVHINTSLSLSLHWRQCSTPTNRLTQKRSRLHTHAECWRRSWICCSLGRPKHTQKERERETAQEPQHCSGANASRRLALHYADADDDAGTSLKDSDRERERESL